LKKAVLGMPMQVKNTVREFLRENPELAKEIENTIREKLGIPLATTLLSSAFAASSVVTTKAVKGKKSDRGNHTDDAS